MNRLELLRMIRSNQASFREALGLDQKPSNMVNLRNINQRQLTINQRQLTIIKSLQQDLKVLDQMNTNQRGQIHDLKLKVSRGVEKLEKRMSVIRIQEGEIEGLKRSTSGVYEDNLKAIIKRQARTIQRLHRNAKDRQETIQDLGREVSRGVRKLDQGRLATFKEVQEWVDTHGFVEERLPTFLSRQIKKLEDQD